MEWDRFFEDLEVQFAHEQEADGAAVDVEAERLRVAGLGIRDRLRALEGLGALACETRGGRVSGTVVAVGADWCCLDAGRAHVVPFRALVAFVLDDAAARRSTRPVVRSTALADRMGFGFVLRELARRRAPVRVRLDTQRELAGTIDRAGRDHLDLAEHEAGAPRRSSELRGIRLIALDAVCDVRVDDSRGIGRA